VVLSGSNLTAVIRCNSPRSQTTQASRRHGVKETKIGPIAVERTFGEDEIIVSKTDPKGIITYANRTFLEVAMYTEAKLLGRRC
jgi:hypothetical protein